MKNIKVLGIDLAKNVFQLYGIDSKGKKVISKKVSRSKLIEFVATVLLVPFEILLLLD